MKKIKTLLVVTLCIVSSLFLGCIEDSTVNTKNTINADSVEEYDIATANNAFAFDMYSMIESEDENIFFSPYSIFTAMAICYDGAEGSTKKQISNVFYYPLSKPVLEESSKEMIDTINSANDEYDLKTANALWIRKNYPLNEQFAHNLKIYYDGNVTNVDFRNEPEKSKDIINEWVSTNTNGKIKDIISDEMIDPYNTAIIITNAIYFKGKWINEFDIENTQKELFYNSSSNDEGTLIDMMYTRQYFNYGESEDAKIVELPYKGNDLCMYIVLPEENNIDDFENRFTLSYYNKLKSSMESEKDVRIWLPKFKFNTKNELSNTLRNMGIVEAFTSNANFSSISTRGDLSISEVIHQAYIDVNEEGTEAAAATAIEATDSAPMPGQIMEFKADHPFMFFIEDKRTGSILFMGKVGSPESEEMS
ncbi:serpin family protein [Methanococcoides burtonii]|uniref:Family I4 proteinase inhibitor, serpin n=1 Tax=Methanococcoides burtonii (strain DSM 6242 / NBRC 107633 / OCM 468 / ACE-M) TaxID=259564 RepID=Q12Y09_METBU|nr:serpin family protein [Methanococcoides burtonii]ABE51667.1 Family I4 proteinase inhibitor, serpin [Methanococcoides burtonii DSM 6242]